MTHELVAQVWAHLKPHLALDSALLNICLTSVHEADSLPPAEALEVRVRFIVWTKTIIDLQRARLQATKGVASYPTELRSSLISQELIFTTLRTLLQTKSHLLATETTTSDAIECIRIYLLQTIVCALRLLILRNEPVPTLSIKGITIRLNSVWSQAAQEKNERYMLDAIIPEALRCISAQGATQDSEDAELEFLRDQGIPAGSEDLTDLRLRPTTFVAATYAKLASSPSEDFFPYFWRTFDALWAAESAIVQCLLEDSQPLTDDSASWTTLDDRFHRANLVRDALFNAIFDPGSPSEEKDMTKKDGYRVALASTLLSCAAVDNPDGAMESLGCPLRKSSETLEDVFTEKTHSVCPYVEQSLFELVSWLHERTNDLPRPDSPTLSCEHNVVPLGSEVAIVPLLEKSASSFQRIEQFTISSSGTCILAWSKHTDFVVRYDIETACFESPVTQKDVIGVFANPLAVAGGRSLTVALVATGSLEIFFSWNEKRYDWAKVRNETTVPDNIQLSVSRDDSVVGLLLREELFVYQTFQSTPSKIAIHDRVELYRSYAIHRAPSFPDLPSDQRLQEVKVLGIVRERHFSFSPRNHLITATTLSDDHVYIDVWDVAQKESQAQSETPAVFPLPLQLSSDRGLSAVFYDDDAKEAFVAADIGRPYPVHVPLHSEKPPEKLNHARKAVAAAQSRDGKAYLIVNSGGEASIVRHPGKDSKSSSKIERRKKADIGISVQGRGNVAVAITDQNATAIAWKARDGKLWLKIMEIDTGKHGKHLVL